MNFNYFNLKIISLCFLWALVGHFYFGMSWGFLAFQNYPQHTIWVGCARGFNPSNDIDDYFRNGYAIITGKVALAVNNSGTGDFCQEKCLFAVDVDEKTYNNIYNITRWKK